jgi:shikimate dehydrogenase
MFEYPTTKIDATTELYGIMGHPVNHSLSPLLHNTAFKKFELNATYMAFDVAPEMLCLAFEAIRSLNIKGMNLTIPHKEEAMNFIDEIPEDVDRGIAALNTIVNKNGILYGYNTDAPGFLISLREELNFSADGKRIVILGAGGSARAALFALGRAGAETIWILNRSIDRAQGLKEYAEPFFPETEIEVISSSGQLLGETVHLVVNATPQGMKDENQSPLDLKEFNKTKVYDLVYAPPETPLIKQAKSLGFPSANGLGMLANQAALSFELWTGKKDGVRELMKETIKKCSV